ncbi:hypothetical protein BC833DRAFT_618757 [Globomyces pollinis-pini]|nr:hypothetical protein BC833DRAFT_618757 [Globomyces pollinis-pini]
MLLLPFALCLFEVEVFSASVLHSEWKVTECQGPPASMVVFELSDPAAESASDNNETWPFTYDFFRTENPIDFPCYYYTQGYFEIQDNELCCASSTQLKETVVQSANYVYLDVDDISNSLPVSIGNSHYCQFTNSILDPDTLMGYQSVYVLQGQCFHGILCDIDSFSLYEFENCTELIEIYSISEILQTYDTKIGLIDGSNVLLKKDPFLINLAPSIILIICNVGQLIGTIATWKMLSQTFVKEEKRHIHIPVGYVIVLLVHFILTGSDFIWFFSYTPEAVALYLFLVEWSKLNYFWVALMYIWNVMPLFLLFYRLLSIKHNAGLSWFGRLWKHLKKDQIFLTACILYALDGIGYLSLSIVYNYDSRIWGSDRSMWAAGNIILLLMVYHILFHAIILHRLPFVMENKSSRKSKGSLKKSNTTARPLEPNRKESAKKHNRDRRDGQ